MDSETNRARRRDKKLRQKKYAPKKLGLPPGIPKYARLKRKSGKD